MGGYDKQVSFLLNIVYFKCLTTRDTKGNYSYHRVHRVSLLILTFFSTIGELCNGVLADTGVEPAAISSTFRAKVSRRRW